MSKNPPHVQSRFSPWRPPPSVIEGPSLCRQEFADEANINILMARYAATGYMPQPFKSPPVARYGDFAEAPDFLAAQLVINEAREQFAGLPVRLRDRFRNDPVMFLEFVHDPENRDEARKLGLLQAEPPAPPPPPKEG